MDTEARDTDNGWPRWVYILAATALLALPFLLVAVHWPIAALVGWVAVVCLYLIGLAIYGDGCLIEGGCATFILAVLAALIMFLVAREREHNRRTVGTLPRIAPAAEAASPPNTPLQPTSGGHARGGSGSMGSAARG